MIVFERIEEGTAFGRVGGRGSFDGFLVERCGGMRGVGRREGKGREGKGREGKGREGKGRWID